MTPSEQIARAWMSVEGATVEDDESYATIQELAAFLRKCGVDEAFGLHGHEDSTPPPLPPPPPPPMEHLWT